MGKLESLGGVGRVVGVLAGGLLYDRMGTAFEGWGFYHGILFWISGIIMFMSISPMFLVPEGGIGTPPALVTLTGVMVLFALFYIEKKQREQE